MENWGWGQVVPDGVGVAYSLHAGRIQLSVTKRTASVPTLSHAPAPPPGARACDQLGQALSLALALARALSLCLEGGGLSPFPAAVDCRERCWSAEAGNNGGSCFPPLDADCLAF
ncbi:hypothetical protein FNF29_07851 [Cafeteria roenbergensis]|uniref:Uncharacterized protein n=1 Tax=Cafeteria roenbergensis TaxID=33653 RepID=A0A5A8C3N8_CAFRO|nr:hypothetical protein FNF29_07851 [Cafeteria roenbergensis]|eukprot:KAA0146730.1 hypothetical protein FNF29_07851 [Cafeteria roenbergensis]